MRDRIPESESFATPLNLQGYQRPLVLAPHPDDEVYGCGGLLALWAEHGIRAHVVLVTDGQAQLGDAHDAAARLKESQAAAGDLGFAVEHWDLSDRGLRCADPLIERILARLQALDPDVVLAPALCEPHPDHQALCLALACAMARWSPASPLPDVLLYESGGALTHATAIVDITSVREAKERAMARFASQESAQPYRSRIQARDHFRAITLGPTAQAAEAFQWVNCRARGWPAWVAALEPLFAHDRGQAATPHDVPLVSVLVRTVGDAHLPRTLASVMAQTYPRLDVVVVAAHGVGQPPVELPQRNGAEMRWISTGSRLNRPEAANAALDAARGDLLIFLDDDDLWTPEHVQKLVSAYKASGTACAVHTDVRVVDEHGVDRACYDQPFVAARMTFTNVLPIHSVLFERRLVHELGCRFDETLPVLEDWDFWLQVSSHGELRHVPGVSALYRWQDRSGLESDDHRHHHRAWRDRVQARWLARWPEDRLLQAARWYAAALDTAQQRAKALDAERARASGLAMELDAAAHRLRQALDDASAARESAARAQERVGALELELHLAGQRLSMAAQESAEAREQVARLTERSTSLELELRTAGVRLAQAVEDATHAREGAARESTERTRLSLELAGVEGARRELASQVMALQDRVAELREVHASLLASTSWRITRPLRWLGGLLRGRRGERQPF